MNDHGRFAVLAIFALLIFPQGCRQRSAEGASLLLGRDEILERDPDAEREGCWRAWIVERSPNFAAYYIEVLTHSPLAFSRYADRRILVLSGEMKLRLNSREASFGPGAMALIPPRSPYRIVKLGQERMLCLMLLSPDDDHRSLLEPEREETR